jgi:hypothetical protein
LKFIDFQLKSIRHIHTYFFWNLDVIIIGDFYQVQPIYDARVFKTNVNNIDSLVPNFWMEKIKCYELKQIMCQSDEQFINILNWFWIATQLQSNVDTINNQHFCTPPNDPKFPYLFYTNEAKQKDNELVFFKVEGMYSYCVHMIDIMIHVLNHFNYKIYKLHSMSAFRGSSKEKICCSNFVLEIMQHMMVL